MSNKLIISCLGDSITQGVGNNDVSWADYLKELIPNSEINKLGLPASRIADDNCDVLPFVKRYNDIPKNSNLIIIFGGVNDFNHAIPLGTIDSVDSTTFYGALNIITVNLLKKFPTADFLFITPMKTFGFKNYPHWNTNNEAGHKLIDYRNAIINIAEKYSIMVLDLFNESGITPDIKELKDLLIPDGLHPSQEGYLRIARKISKTILYRM